MVGPASKRSNASEQLEKEYTTAHMAALQTAQGASAAPLSWLTKLRMKIWDWFKAGWKMDKSGNLTNNQIRDATMGDAERTLPMYSTGSTATLGTITSYVGAKAPEATIGTAISTNTSLPDEWKWASKAITLAAGAAANQEVIAAVAAKKFDCVLINFYLTGALSNANTTQVILGTFQDEDDAAVVGVQGGSIIYHNDLTPDNTSWAPYQPHTHARFRTPTANKALEIDVTGGAGSETLIVEIMYREW